MKFARGNFCALCINPVNFTDFFYSNDSLKVNQNTFEEYFNETEKGFNCLNGIATKFNETVNKFFEKYGDMTNAKCVAAKTQINNLLSSSPVCPNNDCKAMIKNSIKLFGDGAEAQAVMEDSDADTKVGTTARIIRQLQ